MDNHLDAIVQTLRSNYDSFTSIELVTTNIIERSDSSIAPTYNRFVETFKQGMDGKKYYDTLFYMNDEAVMRSTNYSDGKKSASVSYDKADPNAQTSIIIKKDFGREDQSDRVERPIPMLFWYVGRSPLDKAISPETLRGQAVVDGRQYETFSFLNVKWFAHQDQVFYINSQSNLPDVMKAYLNEAERSEDRPAWQWTVKEHQEVQGRQIAVKSETITYDETGKSVTSAISHTVDSIRFDVELPASTFWPETQPGVSTLDSSTQKISTTPGVNQAALHHAQTLSQPIDAAQPSDWSSSVSLLLVAIGVATILLGTVFRGRQAG